MQITRVRIKRTAPGEDGSAWARALEDPAWLAAAEVLKDEPGSSWVRRAKLMGRDVVVKCRALNTVERRVKAGLGIGHGDKHWRGAERLRKAGIATARPLALCRGSGTNECELLVLDYLPGPTVLDMLAAIHGGNGPAIRSQHAIAAAVGDSLLDLIRAKLWNRDHKPSNLIVLNDDPRGPRIAIIDCVAIHGYGWMGLDESEVETMAAVLMTEPIGCGCPPRRALWMRTLHSMARSLGDRDERRSSVREFVQCVDGMIPPPERARPKVNPLRTQPPVGSEMQPSPQIPPSGRRSKAAPGQR